MSERRLRILHSRSALVGGAVLVLIIIAALAAPLISPYDPIKTNQRLSLEQPSLEQKLEEKRTLCTDGWTALKVGR